MGEWREATLGEFCPFAYGKGLPERARIAGTVPVVSSGGVTGSHNKALVEEPGIVIGRKGTVGSVFFINGPFWPIDTAFYVPVSACKGDIRFFYFLLKTLNLDSMNWDAAVPGLNRDGAHSIRIRVPPLPEQRAIANVLSALDDKIELNRRMNATLEAMARAIFRDWFVDFGPTRAKMEGRAPYLAPDLWPLFPARLTDQGIPEGWEEKPLDEIAQFLNGLAMQKYPGESEPDSLPVIKIAELRNGVSSKSNRASRNIPSQYVVQDGDFLFSWSGSLLAKFWTGGEGALNQHLFKVSSERYPAWFFSQWVYHHLEEFQRIAATKATTMGHIQRGHLKAAKAVCPPDRDIELMGEIMAPLVERMIHNDLESRTLARTRDLLLPRLMSGEIRVAEAEKIAEGKL